MIPTMPSSHLVVITAASGGLPASGFVVGTVVDLILSVVFAAYLRALGRGVS